MGCIFHSIPPRILELVASGSRSWPPPPPLALTSPDILAGAAAVDWLGSTCRLSIAACGEVGEITRSYARLFAESRPLSMSKEQHNNAETREDVYDNYSIG
ncbi:hypothetical protein J3F83DRAFT_741973 [Trichoderma novae-zelandiae]